MQTSELFINGKWVKANNTQYQSVESPSTGELLGKTPIADEKDVAKAVEAAREAQEKWRLTHHLERSKLLLKSAQVIENRADELARHICLEQGKPISDAKIEVQGCVDYFRGAAEDIKRLETAVIPSNDPNKKVFTFREPLGVFAVITPWNFPFDLPCFILAPLLASGNSFVFKPAEQTPLSGALIVECLNEAGFPEGVVNLVQGPGETTGEALTSSEGIDAIAFTGSIETGKRIAGQAGKTIKTLLFELGGNGPTIILDDANLKNAVNGVSLSCFMNSGQVCNSGERIIVSESVYDRFAKEMVKAASAMKLGNPLNEETTMGPLINESLVQKVESHVQKAAESGAKIEYGGQRADGFPTKLYFPPTVLTNVTQEMLIANEETFGPVCPMIRCSNIDEMLKVANSTEYGLMGSIYCDKIDEAFYITERLKTGTVAINTPSAYWEGRLPWGGMRKSGLGRQGGMYSLLSMTQLKTVIVDVSRNV